MVDQMIREAVPVPGQPACPVPQFVDEDSGVFERLEGKSGAANMRVIGANNNKLNVNIDGSIPITDNSASITIDNPQLTGVYDTTTHYLGVAVANVPHVVVDSGIITSITNPVNVEEAHLHNSYDVDNTAIKVNVVAGSTGGGDVVITDEGGEHCTVTSGKLDTNATIISKSLPTTHHDAVVAPADGTDATVTGYKIIAVQINGTSSSRAVQFSGSVDGAVGSFYPVMGVNMATWDSATSTTGTGELWQFDIGGLNYFRARVDAVSGGNVTVKSNVVV